MIAWNPVSDLISTVLSSSVFGAAIASAFGALFGAWGAQLAISRNQNRQSFITDSRNINAALSLCFSISNIYLSIKRQHVLPMWQRYIEQQKSFEAFQNNIKDSVSTKQPKFELTLDLETLSPIKAPINALEKQIFEKLSLNGKALAAANQLLLSIDNLNDMLQQRNNLICEFRNNRSRSDDEIAKLYLGISVSGNEVDQRYASVIDGIRSYLDDCIFFTWTLEGEIASYGRALRKRHSWFRRPRAPKMNEADWSKAEKEGLLPDPNEYIRWSEGFKSHKSRAARVRKWIVSQIRGK